MKGPSTAAVIPLCAAAAFALGHIHPFGNPRVEPATGRGTLLRSSPMPAQAKAVLINKCADCHSAETRWPFYAGMAPGSWLIERDIVEARKHLNLSHWAELSPEEQEVLQTQIVQQARAGDMPPVQYRLLHWNAILSRQDIQTLTLLRKNGRPVDADTLGTGDAAHGRLVFEKRCTGCHAIESDREGPHLAQVFGRKAGSVTGFAYSPALKNSGIVWGDTTLERWLVDPDTLVPDNNMSVAVPKAEDRRDLIAYLKR